MGRPQKRTGQIDVLVNAAGIAQFQLLQNTSPQAASELLDTNLMGTIFMSRYMAQRMKRRRADRDGKSWHTCHIIDPFAPAQSVPLQSIEQPS